MEIMYDTQTADRSPFHLLPFSHFFQSVGFIFALKRELGVSLVGQWQRYSDHIVLGAQLLFEIS